MQSPKSPKKDKATVEFRSQTASSGITSSLTDSQLSLLTQKADGFRHLKSAEAYAKYLKGSLTRASTVLDPKLSQKLSEQIQDNQQLVIEKPLYQRYSNRKAASQIKYSTREKAKKVLMDKWHDMEMLRMR
jgi:hypothetical protein